MNIQEEFLKLGETICQPRFSGELNILDIFLWNKAALCKYSGQCPRMTKLYECSGFGIFLGSNSRV